MRKAHELTGLHTRVKLRYHCGALAPARSHGPIYPAVNYHYSMTFGGKMFVRHRQHVSSFFLPLHSLDRIVCRILLANVTSI